MSRHGFENWDGPMFETESEKRDRTHKEHQEQGQSWQDECYRCCARAAHWLKTSGSSGI